MRCLIALVLLLPGITLCAQRSLEVEVVLSVAAAGGTLRLALCPDENAFGNDKGCALHTAAANGSVVRITVGNAAPGTHAIKVFHDVNDNGKLDTNWLGIPTEPYGFSNDAMGTLGPPSFQQAQFIVGQKPTTIRIRMKG
jgi:uncharacterized protein (DUF2141 family)